MLYFKIQKSQKMAIFGHFQKMFIPITMCYVEIQFNGANILNAIEMPIF